MTNLSQVLGNPDRLAALDRTGLLDSATEEAFDRLTRLASKILGTPVALVSLVDDQRQFFKSQHGLAEPWASRRETPLSHSFCQYVVAEGQPLVVSDAHDHPLVRDNLAIEDLGVVAYAGIPLETPDGQHLGSFCAIDSQPRQWTEEEIETLRDLAASVMTEIDLRLALGEAQQQAKEADDERSEKLALLNSSGDGIYGVDQHGRCTFINNTAAEMLGYSPEELQGRDLHALFHHSKPDGSPYPVEECPMYLVLHGNKQMRCDTETFWRRDGSCFPVEYSCAPVLHEGAITGAVVTFTDITRRKQLENRLVLQYAVTSTLAEATSFDEAIKDLLHSIGTALGWRVGAAWLLDRAAQVMRCSATWQAAGSRADEFEMATRHMTFRRGEGLPGKVWETLAPIWITDLAEHQYLPRATLAAEAGLGGGVFFPIKSGKRFLGVLEFFSHSVAAPDRELLSTVAALGNQIGQFLERRRAEEKLHESELLKRAILETALDCIITIDHAGRIVEWNPAAEQAFGYRSEEACGRDLAELIIPPALREQHYQGLRRYIETGEGPVLNKRIELTAIRADGSEFPVEVAITPIHLDEQLVFTGYLRDITERKQSEEELRGAKEAAEVASQAKSQFLANMSHELRTPLNSVILYSELLQEEAEEQALDSFVPDLQKIQAAGRQLLSLVNDLLDLSKIEAGKMDLYLERFEIAPMIDDVATVIQPLVEQKRNILRINCAQEIGSMEGDLTKIRQNLFNLLANASKFTEQGTITLDIYSQEHDGNDWIVFRVTDTGIGMTREHLSRLFQPFTQADTSTTRTYGGTGLGLTITKRFTEIMGGRIEVESAAGVGSMFTFSIPRAPITVAQAESSTPAPARDGAATVLIIDDDPIVHDLMTRILSKEGFHVLTASSGEQGLQIARETRPDIITLDVVMSQMDGWSVLAALKVDPELAAIPVVMLTMMDEQNLGFALGAAEYLTKPLDRDRLLAVLRKYRQELQQYTVMVIDDDEGMRQSLRGLLERQGYEVIEAENGQAGLQKLAAQPPSLILLDLIMPEMDGFEFAAELKRHADWRTIPIIALTAKDLSAEERQRLTGSVANILEKRGCSYEELADEIRQLVARPNQRSGASGSGTIQADRQARGDNNAKDSTG